ncbi:hypothetical protein H1R20_g9995, partial [Candolleomyces eurysporus]
MVKFAVPIFVAALLATSAVASSFVDFNEFESRDAAEYEELSGRSPVVGARRKSCSVTREFSDEEFDDLTARDLELFSHVEELLRRAVTGARRRSGGC